ncbi:MAG: NUDIX hydrolase [Armatimonadota bacterium]
MTGSDRADSSQLWISDLYDATGYSMAALGLIHSEGRVLLALSAHDRQWGFLGGPVRRMETPADALRRSILATTGVCVRVKALLGVVHNPCACCIELVFETRLVQGCEVRLDREEVLRAAWFRMNALPANVRECVHSAVEAFMNQRATPFLVTHRGGEGGAWHS